jgi:hypothetical protein
MRFTATPRRVRQSVASGPGRQEPRGAERHKSGRQAKTKRARGTVIGSRSRFTDGMLVAPINDITYLRTLGAIAVDRMLGISVSKSDAANELALHGQVEIVP